jgi:hypothetical protein
MDDTNRRGRKPSGPEYVQHLEGSAQAKQRLQAILETMTGRRGVLQTCTELSISETRFYQLREELLQAALERLEQRPAGRPRRLLEQTDAAALQEQIQTLTEQLEGAWLREEIALILPHASTMVAEREKKRPSDVGGLGRAGGRSDGRTDGNQLDGPGGRD